MLEGVELEGKLGDFGSYSVDVNATGKVLVALEVEKIVVDGLKIVSKSGVEIDLFMLLEMVAKKTSAAWDDIAVSKIRDILNIAS